MNRNSSPPYSWTNYAVTAVGGALQVRVDDGGFANPTRRTLCFDLDAANDVTVDIYYTLIGARALEGVAGSERRLQAIGPWLNEHMCPFKYTGAQLE